MPSSFTVAFVLGATPGKWARVWRERLPETAIELVPSDQAEALALLKSAQADVALVRLPIDKALESDRPLAAIALYTERAVVVVPKGHELAEFDSLNLAALDGANVIEHEWQAAVELAAANVGVVVLPQAVARALARKDVVTRPLDDGPEWQVAVAWRDGSIDPLVEEFIGIVRGRTARSSRGSAGETAPEPAEKAKRDGRMKGAKKSTPSRTAGRSSNTQAGSRRPPRSSTSRNKRRKK